MIGVFVLQNAQASNSDVSVANFDESEIYNSFNEINDVVSYIESNNNVTYSDLNATNLSFSNLSDMAAIATSGLDENGQPPLMSAFWWGCIFGPVGIAVVAVTTDSDKAQIKKAATGCVIPVGCSLLSWAAYYALYIAAANTY